MAKVLIVDDDRDHILELKNELEERGYDVDAISKGEKAREKMLIEMPDMVLLDMRMPGMSGIEALQGIKQDEKIREIPLIIMTGDTSDQNIITALNVGASDFVTKPIEYQILVNRMRSALQLVAARRALRTAHRALETLTVFDPLTRCYNRAQFFSLSNAEFAKAKRHKRPLSVLMIDIDDFKYINDTFGNLAGDLALKSLVDFCRKESRESDVIGRVSGEEFALTLPDADIKGALVVAERIRNRCAESCLSFNNREFSFTVSVGIACIGVTDDSFDSILYRADTMLSQACESGNRCAIGQA